MERYRHVVPLGFSYERPRDELDLGLPLRVDVLEHRRVVRRSPLRREHVHLPRIVMQLDPGCCRNRLALVDETVDEVTEVICLRLLREVEVVWEPRQRSGWIDRGVEDELRPLRRPQVGKRL